MDIITGLQSKNNREAYQLLLMLEQRSAESDELYDCFDSFVELLKSGSAFVRVRGFRLACAQAQWDTEGKLDQTLDTLLVMLNDPKPTAVRQCLEALSAVVLHKPNLRARIGAKLDATDLTQYKDSMRPLIEKDIASLRKSL